VYKDKWQKVWKQVLDMAYNGSHIESVISIPYDSIEYDILKFWMKNDRESEQLTLEYVWKQYDDTTLNVVPQLKTIYVPKILFDCLGVNTFMQTCFPCCQLVFWEDKSMP